MREPPGKLLSSGGEEEGRLWTLQRSNKNCHSTVLLSGTILCLQKSESFNSSCTKAHIRLGTKSWVGHLELPIFKSWWVTCKVPNIQKLGGSPRTANILLRLEVLWLKAICTVCQTAKWFKLVLPRYGTVVATAEGLLRHNL